MEKTWKIVHIISILLAAIVTQVFFLLCMTFFRGEWEHWLYLLALIGGTVLNIALVSVDIIFYLLGKEIVYKACILTYILLVFATILFYVLLETGFMEIFNDEDSLESYLERTGTWMSVLFIVIQFLQVIVLPIPSTVTVVVGSALFGPLRGSLYSLLGIVLGSLTGFLIGRYAGYRVVAWLVGRDTLEKWLKKIKGKDKLLLSAMFLLPVFPDDVLCFVAGLSSMSVWYFLIVIIISRVLAIFTTSYSISVIPFNTWWGILTWTVLGVLVLVLFIILYRKSDEILGWFEKKFHRETRIEEKTKKGEFTIEVINPDGAIVKKGVERREENETK